MLRTCFSTVPSVTQSRWAIPALERPLSHQRQHLTLARAQRRQRIIASPRRHQLRHQRGVHHRSSLGDALQRLHEIGHIGNPTLEQITNAVPTAQQLHRMLDLHMRREHQDGDIGKLLTNYPSRIQPFGGMRRRHPNVSHHQLGRTFADQRQQLPTVAGLPHYLKPERTSRLANPSRSSKSSSATTTRTPVTTGSTPPAGPDSVADLDSKCVRVLRMWPTALTHLAPLG